MAEFTRRTVLANPAPRRRRAAAAPRKRRLTPAQIAAGFGGKRRKAAARTARAGRTHRAVTRKTTSRRPRNNSQRRRTAPRSNPGDIITLALANPAPRKRTRTRSTGRRRKPAANAQSQGDTSMARSKRRTTRRRRSVAAAPRRRRAARRNPAPRAHRRRRTRRNPVAASPRRRIRRTRTTSRRRTRRNPSMRAPGVTGLVSQAAWAIGGAVGSKFLTQMVLGSSNTGFVGYGANLAAAFVLGTGVKMVLRNQAAGNAVILGGVIQTLLRVLIDKTPLGARVSNIGMGDYMAQNYLTPQRVVDGLNSAQLVPPMVAAAPAAQGVGAIRRLY